MKKRGKGIGCVCFGIGNTAAVNPAAAYVEVLPDGSVQVLTGAADLGQGSDTILAQIAAEVLGVNLNKVKVVSADTGVTPDGGMTSASRQTYVSGNAVRLAAETAKDVLLEVAERFFNVRKELLVLSDDRILCPTFPDKNALISQIALKCRAEGRIPIGSGWFNPPFMPLNPETGQGAPFKTYTFGTQIAEVEVDTDTGEVELLNVWAAYDIGTAININGAEGQIEGGVVMGIGQTLMEEVIQKEGKIVSDSFSKYLLPTVADIPKINVSIVESYESSGPFGAKGLGEPAHVPSIAAIANAIADAIGVYITELPITPERILEAIKMKFDKN